jgi:tRNA-modifying protein YgfZ
MQQHRALPSIDDSDVRESMVPAELGASVIARAVSFTKGCYPGQELVARLDARSALPPHPLIGIASSVPLDDGEDILVGSKVVGSLLGDLVSDAGGSWRGLGVVKRAAVGEQLACKTGALQTLPLV